MSKLPVTNTLKEFKSLLILVALFIAVFVGGWYLATWKAGGDYDLLLSEKISLIENLKIAKNNTTSLGSLLKRKDKQAEELKSIIKTLEEKPGKVKYIVRTETIIRGEDATEIVAPAANCADPPPSHVFQFESGMPIASFTVSEEEGNQTYLYDTADITYEGTIVISENKTAMLLKAESSMQPDEKYTIEVEAIQVQKIRQHKLFEPHLMVSLNASLEFVPIGGDISGTISMPLFHPMDKRLDLLAPKVGFNSKNIRLGADIVSYNLGHDIPVITDLWIGVGTSVALLEGSKYPSLDLSIGSKF